MITEDQITALAREYAEFTDTSDVEKKYISAICENFLRYTLRRYCLVEKSKVEKEYHAVKELLNKIPMLSSAWSALTGQINILEALFPEIVKELKETGTNNRNHENSWCENEL